LSGTPGLPVADATTSWSNEDATSSLGADSGGLACTFESLSTESNDGFGKDALIIGMDGAGVDLIMRALVPSWMT
jgi:hypothetical protein